jgi:hypothetical protein
LTGRGSTILAVPFQRLSIGFTAPLGVYLVKIKEAYVRSGSRGESPPQPFKDIIGGSFEA